MTSMAMYSSDESYQRQVQTAMQARGMTGSSAHIISAYSIQTILAGSPVYVNSNGVVEICAHEEKPESKNEGNCRTCWAPLAGNKRSIDKPDECAECGEL